MLTSFPLSHSLHFYLSLADEMTTTRRARRSLLARFGNCQPTDRPTVFHHLFLRLYSCLDAGFCLIIILPLPKQMNLLLLRGKARQNDDDRDGIRKGATKQTTRGRERERKGALWLINRISLPFSLYVAPAHVSCVSAPPLMMMTTMMLAFHVRLCLCLCSAVLSDHYYYHHYLYAPPPTIYYLGICAPLI